MIKVDLLITHAKQLVTCASPNGRPKRGADMADVGIIEDGALAIDGEKIVAVGRTAELLAGYTARETIDAVGVVCPGLVDCHTHLIFAGDRVNEFEMRIKGAQYLDILAAGGGILNTVRATREAERGLLQSLAHERLDMMVKLGTTTVEAKSGYGLNTETELKILRALAELGDSHPVELIPTFMGAHAVPPEYKDNPDGYVDLVVNEMIPAAAEWYKDSLFAAHGIPLFNDVFCEKNAFDVQQSRRILEAGIQHGLRPKAHVDEFNALGGLEMALELGAISVDHLDVTDENSIAKLAQSDTIGVIMPAVNFHLGSTHYANARGMIDAGASIALATDLNPGSAPCYSMPLVMAMACRYQKLTPAEALNAATINAAHAIGMGQRVGSLEVGKQADVLIGGMGDYRHMAYELGVNQVHRVIKRGKTVWNILPK